MDPPHVDLPTIYRSQRRGQRRRQCYKTLITTHTSPTINNHDAAIPQNTDRSSLSKNRGFTKIIRECKMPKAVNHQTPTTQREETHRLRDTCAKCTCRDCGGRRRCSAAPGTRQPCGTRRPDRGSDRGSGGLQG